MKVLFITHESSRTGAPLMLLYFMEWLSKNRSDINYDVLTLRPGIIDLEYKKLARHHFKLLKKSKGDLKQQLIEKLKKKILKKGSVNEITLNKVKEGKYDIIYANSIVSLSTAIFVKFGNAKVVAHIHEMEVNIFKYAPNFEELIPHVDHFIAASESVKRDLNKYNIIKENSISVIYEISKVKDIQINKRKKEKFIVGGSGLAGWRKGTDVFIQIANYINIYFKEYDIQFEWLGRIKDSQMIEIESDVKKMNLLGNVEFLGEQENPQEYYQNFDIFLLTSREDPFPLVCIELGMLGKPILCFENATGSAEMLSEQEGVIIPYLDIRSMAEKIILLYENSAEIKKLGDANKRVFSRFAPELICPKIIETLDKLVS